MERRRLTTVDVDGAVVAAVVAAELARSYTMYKADLLEEPQIALLRDQTHVILKEKHGHRPTTSSS